MNDIAQVANPISGDIAARPGAASTAAAATDQQRAIAEVQAAMVIARANPRDERRAVDRILNACMRRGLAEMAVYSYSRGGSDISGPSIRLAEAIAQNWGNIQFGIREVAQRGGESEVQAFAWDVETNVRREVTFTVPHVRHTRQGTKRLEDPRDIYENVANNGARRVRACILAVIPGDIIEAAVEQCEKTLKSNADTSPEGIQAMVNAFLQFNVVQQQLEQRIQRRLDAIQPAQIVALKKIYASLRDGMSTPNDWFEPIPDDEKAEGDATPTKGVAAAKAALKKATGKKEEISEPAQSLAEALGDEIPAFDGAAAAAADNQAEAEDETEPDTDDEAGETDGDEESPITAKLREIRGGINAAKNLKYLAAVDKEWVNARAAYDDETVAEIDGLISAKRRELQGGEGGK